MRHAILFAVLALLGASGAWAETVATPAPRSAVASDKSIRELIEVTGAAKVGAQMLDQMLGPLRQAMPNVPEEFWRGFRAKADAKQLVELTVPIYRKHMTQEEVDGLLKFYRTPVGRSVIAKLPLIARESVEAGQRWGEQVGKDLEVQLKQKGYL